MNFKQDFPHSDSKTITSLDTSFTDDWLAIFRKDTNGVQAYDVSGISCITFLHHFLFKSMKKAMNV